MGGFAHAGGVELAGFPATTSSVEENLIAVKQAHLDAQARRPFPSGGNDSTD